MISSLLTAKRSICFRRLSLAVSASVFVCLLFSAVAQAHGVADGDKGYIQEISGLHLLPFTYLGAKHMVTGYDHLLFLAGVIFFLYRLKDIAIYVSLFAVGHSLTMLYGVYAGVNVNAYAIDAIIGLSVVYKALDKRYKCSGCVPNVVDIIIKVTEEYHQTMAGNAAAPKPVAQRLHAMRRKRAGGRNERRSTGHRAA